MQRFIVLAGGIALVSMLAIVPDRPVSSAPMAQTAVRMTCSRPVLDVFSGQPVFIGGLPWYAETGDTVMSHPWQGQPRYEFGGRRYHYIGGVAGPNRAFLVEDCEQPPAPPLTGPPPAASLQRLAPDVYAVEHTGYTSVFIVTDEGVIVGDPMGTSRAPHLKAAIESVTSLPVRYMVYSHSDADHNTGGAVFADTATFVSHINARDKIAARTDGSPVPTVTFDDRMTLRLGRTRLELVYVGWNHSDNSLVLLYPDRRIAWAVDFIPVNRLPFRRLAGDYIRDWIESLRRVEAMDFDILIPGHLSPGPKQWVTLVREYFQDLIGAVEAAERLGLAPNSPEMITSVRAALYPRYGAWESFGPWLPENIEGLYDYWAREGR